MQACSSPKVQALRQDCVTSMTLLRDELHTAVDLLTNDPAHWLYSVIENYFCMVWDGPPDVERLWLGTLDRATLQALVPIDINNPISAAHRDMLHRIVVSFARLLSSNLEKLNVLRQAEFYFQHPSFMQTRQKRQRRQGRQRQ